MKKDKYLNFMGDTQNYKIRPVPPNPYGMRGNPDEFDWSMDQRGDGLNGTPAYSGFDGGSDMDNFERWSNHPGFIGGFGEKIGGWFKRSDDKMMKLPDGDGGYDEYSWGEIQADSSLMTLYNTNQDLKKAKRKEWWNNFGKQFGSFTSGFSNSYSSTQAGNNPLLTSPTPINITPDGTNAPKEAGMGTSKIIGWVLVGGVVIGLLFYAMKGDDSKTIIVQQPGV